MKARCMKCLELVEVPKLHDQPCPNCGALNRLAPVVMVPKPKERA